MLDSNGWLALASLLGTGAVGIGLRLYATGRWISGQEAEQIGLRRELTEVTAQLASLLGRNHEQDTRLRQVFMSKEVAEERALAVTDEREHVRKQLSYLQDEVKGLASAMHRDFSDLRDNINELRRGFDQRR